MLLKRVFLIGAVVALAIAALLFLGRAATQQAVSYDAFAKCLAANEITMYGADWCPHCQNEKRAFGSSFQFVPYVECPDNPKLCIEKGIQGYPTWIFPDGRRLLGEQGLEKLAQASGCPLE